MITAHFSGEIVRHMDVKKINQIRQERYATEKRCRYGITELNCNTWVKHCQEQSEIKKISQFGRCSLCSMSVCPMRKQRTEAGNKEKKFSIDGKQYRKIASSAHWLLKEGKHRTVFLTLTFGRFKKQHKLTKSFYYDEISNILFSRFVENLRTNYDCVGYIGVKEYGEVTKRIHFHLITCLPYIPFLTLNNVWNNTISCISEYSNCALRTDKNKSAIIRNANRAVRYVCKYVSKLYGTESRTRIVFISNNILKNPISIEEQLPRFGDYYLKEFKSLRTKVYEYTTVFYITDRREFNKFCWKFLYPLFECSIKPSKMEYLKGDIP